MPCTPAAGVAALLPFAAENACLAAGLSQLLSFQHSRAAARDMNHSKQCSCNHAACSIFIPQHSCTGERLDEFDPRGLATLMNNISRLGPRQNSMLEMKLRSLLYQIHSRAYCQKLSQFNRKDLIQMVLLLPGCLSLACCQPFQFASAMTGRLVFAACLMAGPQPA